MSSDNESPAVVELPDDLIEANAAAQLAVMRTAPPSLNDVIATVLIAAEPLIAARVRAEALREAAEKIAPNQVRPSNVIVVGARMTDDVLDMVRTVEDALVAAVRAEAVADERRRIVGLIDAARRQAQRGDPMADNTDLILLRREVAAGSVPVATPPAESAAEQLLRDIFMDPGPVATPTGHVHGFAISGRRVCGAVATPTEPAHMHNWDGPCPACASATPTEQALTPDDCTCEDDGGCIDYYDEDRPGDCAYCQDPRFGVNDGATCPAVLRVPAASPVPAEQPTCKHGETAPHGVGQYAPGSFPDHYCPGPMVAEQPEPKGVAGHAPGCDGWRPPRALGFGRSIPYRCKPGCPRTEQPEER